jgi:hypothetical protein
MTEDDRALLQAQATIFSAYVVANAIYAPANDLVSPQDEMLDAARAVAHMLAQNLDLNSGKP